jgi:hypothetical protein
MVSLPRWILSWKQLQHTPLRTVPLTTVRNPFSMAELKFHSQYNVHDSAQEDYHHRTSSSSPEADRRSLVASSRVESSLEQGSNECLVLVTVLIRQDWDVAVSDRLRTRTSQEKTRLLQVYCILIVKVSSCGTRDQKLLQEGTCSIHSQRSLRENGILLLMVSETKALFDTDER